MSKEIDHETAAIMALANALGPLDDAARDRVIDWATKRYGTVGAAAAAGAKLSDKVAEHRKVPHSTNGSPGSAVQTEFKHFAELFDTAAPSSDMDKALVGGYWLQICNGRESFASMEANALLKTQGYPIGNITRAIEGLRSATPRLMHQLEKSGKSKQARKKLMLTEEGIRAVKRRLAGDHT